MKKINFADSFQKINTHWDPHIVGNINDSAIKIAKIKGEFDWHQHIHEDEAFIVMKGSLSLQLHDQTIELSEGEMFIVPKGTQHRPVAQEECWIMLIEPKSTLNTGDVETEKTKHILKTL